MIKINLLPKEARKRLGIGEQIFIIAAALIITLVGVGVAWRTLNGIIDEKNRQITQTQQRLDELKKVIAEIEAFERQRAALQQKLEIIAKLEKEQQVPVHLLDELFLTLEEDLWLTNFTLSGANINITGVALSNPVVANYTRNLQNSQYFSSVELRFSQQGNIGGQDVRNFQISAILSVPEDLLQSHYK